MYTIVATKAFEKNLNRLPMNDRQRVVRKIKEVAHDPYALHRNVTKLQGRDGYRLRVGDWRVIYTLKNEQMVMLLIDVGARGGIYQ